MPYSSSGADVPSYIHGEKKRRQFSHVWNSAYHAAIKDGLSPKDAESKAFAEANGVVGKTAAAKFTKLLAKSIESDAEEFAAAVIAEITRDFQSLPGEIREPLASASLSGATQGVLQLESGNSGLIASANEIAQEFAAERAAELVGMKYDLDGNLVENPSAKWAISDTTRDTIRQIVADSFTEETPLAEIKQAIQEALAEEASENGIFSPERAHLIAITETTNAQVGGNYSVWQKSGIVLKIKWITAEDERVCPECNDNDQAVVDLGKPFPSGDLRPGAHPRCRCGIVVAEVANS